MYPRATSGSDSNNYKFSKCSRDYIGPVLNAKADICFKGVFIEFLCFFEAVQGMNCSLSPVQLANQIPCYFDAIILSSSRLASQIFYLFETILSTVRLTNQLPSLLEAIVQCLVIVQSYSLEPYLELC